MKKTPNIFTCLFYEIKRNIFHFFFNIKLKIPYKQFLFFLSFTFSEAAVRRSSSKYVLLKISQYSELKETPTEEFFCEFANF